MPKVLVLTAGYGEGHNAAARGLHAALAECGAEAAVIDLFALAGGPFYERSRRGYLALINRAPRIWGAVFTVIDHLPVVPLLLPFLGKMRRTLAALLARERPDAVVSVYPLYAHLIRQLYPEPAARPFAFHTVVTDSITINSIWHRAPSDTFIVPNDPTAEVMRRAGVAPGKLHVLGFPVPLQFARDRPERPAPVPPRILYMINAGQAQAPGIVARLLAIPGLHLTVAYGRDEALRARLAAAAAGRPVEFHGWTSRMPELLMTHHLLIGKAGGATVQESIAAGTPMLITQIVPGQEEGNARLLLENGCGALCPTADALAAQIEALFSGDAGGWRQWQRQIARLARPDAALRIADLIVAGGPALPNERA